MPFQLLALFFTMLQIWGKYLRGWRKLAGINGLDMQEANDVQQREVKTDHGTQKFKANLGRESKQQNEGMSLLARLCKSLRPRGLTLTRSPITKTRKKFSSLPQIPRCLTLGRASSMRNSAPAVLWLFKEQRRLLFAVSTLVCQPRISLRNLRIRLQ